MGREVRPPVPEESNGTQEGVLLGAAWRGLLAPLRRGHVRVKLTVAAIVSRRVLSPSTAAPWPPSVDRTEFWGAGGVSPWLGSSGCHSLTGSDTVTVSAAWCLWSLLDFQLAAWPAWPVWPGAFAERFRGAPGPPTRWAPPCRSPTATGTGPRPWLVGAPLRRGVAAHGVGPASRGPGGLSQCDIHTGHVSTAVSP